MRINEEIHIREVRVTSATGEQLGIMQTRDALRLAEEQHLDLVEVAPKAKPPVMIASSAITFGQLPIIVTPPFSNPN